MDDRSEVVQVLHEVLRVLESVDEALVSAGVASRLTLDLQGRHRHASNVTQQVLSLLNEALQAAHEWRRLVEEGDNVGRPVLPVDRVPRGDR